MANENKVLANLKQFLEVEIFSSGETTITVTSIGFFVGIIIFTFVLSRLIRNRLAKLRQRAEPSRAASLYVIERFSHYIVLGLGFLFALSYLGIDVSHLALLATALSVGIGFGLQSIFNNFFSGIIILFEGSLKVGDFVELQDGTRGHVVAINIRSSTIRTPNSLDILIPNSQFVSDRVSNWTLGDRFRRLQVSFGVAYGTDKDLVKEVVLKAANSLEMTEKIPGREADVWLVNFGDSSLDFQLIVWVDPRKNDIPGGITAQYLWEIETALSKNNIEIPFPQRDLHIKNPE